MKLIYHIAFITSLSLNFFKNCWWRVHLLLQQLSFDNLISFLEFNFYFFICCNITWKPRMIFNLGDCKSILWINWKHAFYQCLKLLIIEIFRFVSRNNFPKLWFVCCKKTEKFVFWSSITKWRMPWEHCEQDDSSSKNIHLCPIVWSTCKNFRSHIVLTSTCCRISLLCWAKTKVCYFDVKLIAKK